MMVEEVEASKDEWQKEDTLLGKNAGHILLRDNLKEQ